MERQAQLRKDGRLPFLRPDAKSQVTMRYVDGKPHSIDTVVLSTQHAPEYSLGHKMTDAFYEAVREEIIKPVLPKEWLTADTKYLINPTGPLRRRRPAGRLRPDRPQDHCRHLRRRLPARRRRLQRQGPVQGGPLVPPMLHVTWPRTWSPPGWRKQCQVQVAYAIGVARPMNITVYTEGTGKLPDDKLSAIVAEVFDLRPKGIIQMLDLLRPIYEKTAAYGHFGREEPEFTWERTDKVAALKAAAGL